MTARHYTYNRGVDFRFKYRRGRPAPEELQEEQRREMDTVLLARQVAFGLAIPISLASGPFAGWWLGALLDHACHTSWITPTLIIVGTVAGFKMVIDMLLRLGKMK